MLAVEVRFEDAAVKVRRFGNGAVKWTVLLPGEVDRLTGWSCEELSRLGEGVWEFAKGRQTAVEV
jgi:hypothetical protein